MKKYSTIKVVFNIFRYMVMVTTSVAVIGIILVSFITGGEAVRGNSQLFLTMRWFLLIGIIISVFRIVSMFLGAWLDYLIEERAKNYVK